MVQAFRPSVGLKRISKGTSSTIANSTRQVRQDMQDIIKEYTRWVDYMDNVSADILYEALEPTFELSQQYVPVKTGDLKASGYLETAKFRGKAVVEIGYARGGQPEYATLVHERTDLYHEPPTSAKYLQRALEEDFINFQARIVSGYRMASGVYHG